MSYIKKNSFIYNVEDQGITASDHECIVNIKYCGICGTDYQMYSSMNEINEWGHEIIGLVEGEEEKGFVTIRTSFPCGKCKECMHNRPQRCSSWVRQRFNGYSQRVVLDRKCILFLQETDMDPVYTLVEPLYVANSLIKRVNLQADDRLAIVGNGTIALLVGFLARQNCRNISIVARHHASKRMNLEKSMGLIPYDYSEMDRILPIYNKVIVTTPYPTLNDVIHNAAPYSMITFNGISKDGSIIIEANNWHIKNLAIWPVFPHPQSEFAEEIKIVKANKSFLNSFITAVYPAERIQDAFHELSVNKKDHIKMVIRF